MVSALTQEGAEVTLQALELGAVDFLPKPQRNQLSEMRASRDLLVAKVLAAAQSRVRARAAPRRPHRCRAAPRRPPPPIGRDAGRSSRAPPPRALDAS